jgi:hypothetical protein
LEEYIDTRPFLSLSLSLSKRKLEEKKELIHPFSKRERGRRKEIKRNIHLLQKERKVGGKKKHVHAFQRRGRWK